MTTDLLLLSSRIALLVLLGSVLAFSLGWFWRSVSLKRRISQLESSLASVQEDRQRLRILLDSAAPDDEIKAGEAQMRELEAQCMSALQQRDEAERHAAEAMNRLRGLQEQLERLERESVPRSDYLQLEADLRAARAAPPPAQDHTAMASLQRDLARLQDALAQSESALTKAREDATRLVHPPVTPAAPPPAATSAEEDFTAFPPAPAMPTRGLLLTQPPAKKPPPPRLDAARKNLATLKQEQGRISDSEELARIERQITALEKALSTATSAGPDTDDLTKIKGIKKVTNNQLLDHAICTWKQIADWTPQDTASFSELLMLGNRVAKERWIEQATALHEKKNSSKPKN